MAASINISTDLPSESIKSKKRKLEDESMAATSIDISSTDLSSKLTKCELQCKLDQLQYENKECLRKLSLFRQLFTDKKKLCAVVKKILSPSTMCIYTYPGNVEIDYSRSIFQKNVFSNNRKKMEKYHL